MKYGEYKLWVDQTQALILTWYLCDFFQIVFQKVHRSHVKYILTYMTKDNPGTIYFPS